MVEVLYRLLPVSLFLWLVSSLLRCGRGQTQVFWVLALLSSLVEPATHDPGALALGASLLLVGSQFVPDFLLNLAEVIMFRNYDFLASNRDPCSHVPELARGVRQFHLPVLK